MIWNGQAVLKGRRFFLPFSFWGVEQQKRSVADDPSAVALTQSL